MDMSSLDFITGLALCEDLSNNLPEAYAAFLKTGILSTNDVTSDAIFGNEQRSAQIIAKSKGILSGTVVCRHVFHLVNPGLTVNFKKSDGDHFFKGDTIVNITGNAKSILIAERTALNFLGHLSGIATGVGKIIPYVKKSRMKILDTRKTTPGMRRLEKEAVVHGGGVNHRMGLYDMVLIKDNHIDAAGSITEAVRKVRMKYGNQYKIEVETRTVDEVDEACSLSIDRVMFDNMPKKLIRIALKHINGKVSTEVSGNMTVEKIRHLRRLPIDFVSMGSITSAAIPADFSLIIEGGKR